ncbi:anti-sigma factor [Nocardia cyriacigeorgica]|uniref:anti-sigma factor n=1 Tax=Nocardia cyriacigeorgica TaxID=135487 RepID=UPI0018945A93|nr:anti-sigma factor [Nocardia cyriacigeorgica]MBF6437042.1 anti-sigma factor [Nocardia cyriacigeorgica]MBF6452611.1 anti-sigma factor [Nocardia cyriacigeorgica]MBF6480106.1 anti-sigma factor [Nocardia cyriacigeorgica]MBF6549780.1 anti-sigma factor [Nocardia cyriacigeorgica]
MTDAPPPEHPDDHDLLDLAHPYALDAVSDAERESIEHRLRVCDPDIRRAFDTIVREVREAMGALSILDAKAPPQELEGRILEAIGERDDTAAPDRDPHDEHGSDELAAARRRRRKFMRWTAAAAAVAAVVAIGAAVLGQRTEEQPPARMVTADQVLRQPDARTETSPVSTGGTLIAHISDELDAVAITFDAVPAPPTGQAHQLWLIGPEGVPRSAGVLSDLPTAETPYVTEFAAADQLAMTIEPAGGSPGPTTDPIAALALS